MTPRGLRLIGVVDVLVLLLAIVVVVTRPADAIAPPVGGPPLTEKTGARLLLIGSDRVSLVDLDAGRAETVRGLIGHPLGGVVQADDAAVVLTAKDSGPGQAYVVRRGSPVASFIGGGARLAGSRDGDIVWLTVQGDVRKPTSVRPIDLNGSPTALPIRLPAYHTLVREVLGGFLVLASTSGPQARLELWPRDITGAHRVIATPRVIVAVSRTDVAWLGEGCGPAVCSVHVTNYASALDRTVILPPNLLADSATGALSPDGNRIALALVRSAPDGGQLIDLVESDLATKRVTVLPAGGLVASGDASVSLGWTGDGRWLLVTVSNTGGSRIGAWRTGADRLRFADVEFPPALLSVPV